MRTHEVIKADLAAAYRGWVFCLASETAAMARQDVVDAVKWRVQVDEYRTKFFAVLAEFTAATQATPCE